MFSTTINHLGKKAHFHNREREKFKTSPLKLKGWYVCFESQKSSNKHLLSHECQPLGDTVLC